ncbi:hypothetical protein Poly41_31320 [Novipirellula artificiosorum]|uniref:Uncharacterized protein n=1 Tax=Novipirellula artificiosorum TaxID=2528016 RepID=A0A5C6DPS0_9BACT|nr:hypothetical protein Poly41_31320 [Novipirellula artificiosorum]
MRGSERPALPVVAQFDVCRKRTDATPPQRIEKVEPVRLRDRCRDTYDSLRLPTNVVEVGSVVPTAVRISTEAAYASTAVVVRWTRVRPLPPPPSDAVEDPRWRWGVLTVSHLFTGNSADGKRRAAKVRRLAACGDGPDAIRGRVIARGRIPGGPDVGLVETGLDRLWLSGFLPRVAAPAIDLVSESELLRWIRKGTDGNFFAIGKSVGWNWRTFYPQLSIQGLGRLRHIFRYEAKPSGVTQPTSSDRHPFVVGTSGGILVSGGIPVGIQVAAMAPEFRIGYAQSFTASIPWLGQQLKASSLAVVNVLT